MPTRKIPETETKISETVPCYNAEHDPPMFMVYENGLYEHTCPGCGRVIFFRVNRPVF